MIRSLHVSPRARARRIWLVAAALGLLAPLGGGLTCCALRLDTRTPPLPTSAQAEDFELPDADGRPVSLASLTARGPAVLVFYRGYW